MEMRDLTKLKPGDEYVLEWNDGDRQRYRVEEIRDGYIVRKRWIEHQGKWTDWLGVQKIAEANCFVVKVTKKS
jgi:hypothetical protein